MRTSFSILAIMLMILISCGKKVKDEGTAEVITPGMMSEQYLEYVNIHRLKLGLEPLDTAEIIQEQALEHSHAMASKKRPFGHYGRPLRCIKIREELGVGNQCAEIISLGEKDALEVFNFWIKSSAQRQIIEGSHFTHTGLGFATDAEGVIYWTQIFYAIP